MKIFHRIDDIREYNEELVEEIVFFENNTKEFIVAIIPNGFSEKYTSLFRKCRNCAIYQHGYDHYNRVQKGWYDEFPDTMNKDEKRSLILKGKLRLENILNIDIRGYVPPWNNTSLDTVNVLKELGFSIYSAQDNNTIKYFKNKDICIDIVNVYSPKILYKNLDIIYNNILTLSKYRIEIGIMYHFKNTTDEERKYIHNFVRKVENLNL